MMMQRSSQRGKVNTTQRIVEEESKDEQPQRLLLDSKEPPIPDALTAQDFTKLEFRAYDDSMATMTSNKRVEAVVSNPNQFAWNGQKRSVSPKLIPYQKHSSFSSSDRSHELPSQG